MLITLSPKIKEHWIDSKNYYSMQSFDKFISYFFDEINLSILNSTNYKCQGTIYDIQETMFSNNKFNIMLCVENCLFWKHYKHFNIYGNYKDFRIRLFLYNHIDRLEVTKNYMAIPIIYLQINYFQKFFPTLKPSIFTPFENKKFCLCATYLNNFSKRIIYNEISKIEKCSSLEEFKPIIANESCYHSDKLINLFNQYKFVFVSENSILDGYITEKIFNCFFSRTIPIYFGSKKISYYFNPKSFIQIKDISEISHAINEINQINNNRDLYESYLNSKILNDFDNENYKEKLNKFISQFL